MWDDPCPAATYDHISAAAPQDATTATEPQIHLCLLFLLCLCRRAISKQGTNINQNLCHVSQAPQGSIRIYKCQQQAPQIYMKGDLY